MARTVALPRGTASPPPDGAPVDGEGRGSKTTLGDDADNNNNNNNVPEENKYNNNNN